MSAERAIWRFHLQVICSCRLQGNESDRGRSCDATLEVHEQELPQQWPFHPSRLESSACRYNGLAEMFWGQDRNILLKMISLPLQRAMEPSLLLAGGGTLGFKDGLASTAEDETKIAQSLALVNLMTERCDETVRTTSRNLRCWLKSVRPNASLPVPFNLVRLSSSTQKYRLHQRKLLAFVLQLPTGCA